MRLIAATLLILALLASGAAAGHTKLLAVSERSDGARTGQVADLYLEVREGSGRVFLDTFPLTQITTQVSMRFAQQIACNELDIDCSGKDFVYTIRAPPGIVAGPSAGAAATILTASVLTGFNISDDIAITGTINSGALIGPVGGLKEKIEAAASNGITTVLIPWGTRMYREPLEDLLNSTDKNGTALDLIEFGRQRGVTVKEVGTLYDALSEFNGELQPEPIEETAVSPRYLRIMEDIAERLCEKRDAMTATAKDVSEEVLNLTRMAADAQASGKPYAQSSFCFRATITLREGELREERIGLAEAKRRLDQVVADAMQEAARIDGIRINTVTDVETYMAVRERLDEIIGSANSSEELNGSDDAIEMLAYLEQRLASAKAWALFFEQADRKAIVDGEQLRDGCQAKIAEAEERMDYVDVYLEGMLGGTRKTLREAYEHLAADEYIRCIHLASMAKAEADVVLNLLGVEEERVPEVIERKMQSVQRSIAKAQRRGVFPLMSYAYYEYGRSLMDTDRGSSLLYAEYALELSALDVYFTERQNDISVLDSIKFGRKESFVLGMIFAFIMMGIISRLHRKAAHGPQRKRRKSSR